MGVPSERIVPFGILEMVTLVPFSVDKIEAKFSTVVSKRGLSIAPSLNSFPKALFPFETRPPA